MLNAMLSTQGLHTYLGTRRAKKAACVEKQAYPRRKFALIIGDEMNRCTGGMSRRGIREGMPATYRFLYHQKASPSKLYAIFSCAQAR